MGSRLTTPGRVVSLDGFRGLATLAMVSFHAQVPGMTNGSYFTMDLFFVLSGFLITGVLLGERVAKGSVRLGRFYYRRLLRLYPALIALLLLLMPFGSRLVPGGDYGRWLRDAALTATYTIDLPPIWGVNTNGGLAHMWSLAIEEQFYLLWAPLLAFVVARRIPTLRTAAWLVVVAAALYVFAALVHRSGANADVIYARPDLRFAELLLGSALTITLMNLPRPLPAGLARVVGPVSYAAAAVFVTMVLFVPQPFSLRVVTFATLAPIAAVCSALMIFRMATKDDALMSRFFRFGPFVFLGTLSYAMYLWHLPLIVLMRPYIDGTWTLALTSIAATLAFAYASRELVEKPFLRRKNRLRSTGVAGLDPAPAGAADSAPVVATATPPAQSGAVATPP